MAALRGTVTGSRGMASRLGSERSGLRTTAATWRTFARVSMDANGAGSFTLEDDHGRTIAVLRWGAEYLPDDMRVDAVDAPSAGVRYERPLPIHDPMGAVPFPRADR
jgi:hypothetical protein